MSTLTKTSLFVVACLAVSCAEQEQTGFSSGDKEFNENAAFRRGERGVGQACAANVDCFSLNCELGICTQPCASASCPRGTICADAIAVLQTQCATDEDCATQSFCAQQGCTCSLQGQCFFDIDPFCLQVCPDDFCGAETTICGLDVSGVKICYPKAYLGIDPNMPPPVQPQVGDPCPMGTECEGDAGLGCNTTDLAAPYCTRECFTQNCPDGSLCVNFDVEYSLCLDDCGADQACATPGVSCVDYDASKVCF